jgi:antitoxin (DNA-binding transcriptional repressor) of toxin-antitoxin stability system
VGVLIFNPLTLLDLMDPLSETAAGPAFVDSLPSSSCDAKMHHMRKATVRDLRYRFSVVEDLLDEGEEVQITKRKRIIARLLPVTPNSSPRRPDFLARLKKLYRGKPLKVSSAELLSSERGRF